MYASPMISGTRSNQVSSPPGSQLSSEMELREEYGPDGKVSRNTVRDAIKLLAARQDGYPCLAGGDRLAVAAAVGASTPSAKDRGPFLRVPSAAR
jgi:Bacterial regulatory proteins, gntR family